MGKSRFVLIAALVMLLINAAICRGAMVLPGHDEDAVFEKRIDIVLVLVVVKPANRPDMSLLFVGIVCTDGPNWYVYARNNPLRYVDPTGLYPGEWCEGWQDVWWIGSENESTFDAFSRNNSKFWFMMKFVPTPQGSDTTINPSGAAEVVSENALSSAVSAIVANIGDLLSGIFKSSGKSDGDDGSIKNTYKSIKDSPNYPDNFEPVKNGTKKHNVKDKDVLNKLRQVEKGKWKKVYKDGYVDGYKASIHYFQSESGTVFDVWVMEGWSN